ncbi:ABC transporter permease subunit [Candidatus Sumerlaeota bacterium]|nr:ABC transporter permease subunit [Candidatus Sumerlaeota bacterium]
MADSVAMNDFQSDRGDLQTPQSNLRRTVFTLVNISMRRYLFTRYMWTLLFLGGVPVAISILFMIGRFLSQDHTAVVSYSHLSDLNKTIQTLFRVLYIHFVIFFIANIFGFSLIRKEVDDRTLHLLFLQPISKVTIILSKYLGFLAVTWLFLSVTFLSTYILFHIPFGLKSVMNDLFQYGRAFSLIKECFVMLVALAMYGAFSMVMGSLFRTGWYGLIFYLWETGLPYLPSTLKYFTISHYLQALTPEKSAIPPKMFELYGELPSPLRCGITFFIALSVLIGITVFLIRRYECKYSEI